MSPGLSARSTALAGGWGMPGGTGGCFFSFSTNLSQMSPVKIQSVCIKERQESVFPWYLLVFVIITSRSCD